MKFIIQKQYDTALFIMGLVFFTLIALMFIAMKPSLIFPRHTRAVELTDVKLDKPIRQKFSRYVNVKLNSEQEKMVFNCAYFRNEQGEVLCDTHSVSSIQSLRGVVFDLPFNCAYCRKDLVITQLIFKENDTTQIFEVLPSQQVVWENYIVYSNNLARYFLIAPYFALLLSFLHIKRVQPA